VADRVETSFFAMTQIARCGFNHNPSGVVASFQ